MFSIPTTKLPNLIPCHIFRLYSIWKLPSCVVKGRYRPCKARGTSMPSWSYFKLLYTMQPIVTSTWLLGMACSLPGSSVFSWANCACWYPEVVYEVIRVLDQHRTLGTYFSPLQILDFLFLIGRLEDQGYNGDSAETALLVSKEDFDKVCVWCSTTEDYTIMWAN